VASPPLEATCRPGSVGGWDGRVPCGPRLRGLAGDGRGGVLTPGRRPGEGCASERMVDQFSPYRALNVICWAYFFSKEVTNSLVENFMGVSILH
jgi:hypothetical protein